ncbi:hypothetical protein [Georgenia satyanarayanai]|uniref:hypothetical protein n=1 Tax=Georgenia satyanarayanai TaxID=860221 RepID=UPI0021AD032E|nr:hypothetical protein [Georgenia satyanarayanai]
MLTTDWRPIAIAWSISSSTLGSWMPVSLARSSAMMIEVMSWIEVSWSSRARSRRWRVSCAAEVRWIRSTELTMKRTPSPRRQGKKNTVSQDATSASGSSVRCSVVRIVMTATTYT